ncbi:DUF6011 domain-containing protein [Streptomyces sp. IBSBF 2435]|uniref:DUF6011 domain-containing protein n=1 Tax=Streptomyces sp. IBSBF 2435 TaxID=2903531 RepID=UPI002FDB9ACC
MNTTAETDAAEVRCLTCHRPLDKPLSRALGRGPVCQAGIDHIAHRGYRHRPPTGDQLALDLDLTTTPKG